MSKYGNSYSGNDFLEWWKTHYGTDYDGKSGIVKTEGMTDEDVAIGKSLLNSYNEQQLLTQQYNENVATETDKYNSQGTTSTTALCMIFHVLQTMLIEETDFQNEQFAVVHPGGAVGERLNQK